MPYEAIIIQVTPSGKRIKHEYSPIRVRTAKAARVRARQFIANHFNKFGRSQSTYHIRSVRKIKPPSRRRRSG